MAEQKTLKTKRIFAYTIYNSLKKIPPKDYPTTGEIKNTITSILPALRVPLDDYLAIVKEVEVLQEQLAAKKITEEEIKVKVDELNEKWKAYNKDHGNEIVEIVLDAEGFATLKAQFEREGWGKEWLALIEEFAELMDSFAEADK